MVQQPVLLSIFVKHFKKGGGCEDANAHGLGDGDNTLGVGQMDNFHLCCSQQQHIPTIIDKTNYNRLELCRSLIEACMAKSYSSKDFYKGK